MSEISINSEQIGLTPDPNGNVTLNMRGQRFVFPKQFLEDGNKIGLLKKLQTVSHIKCGASEYFYDCDAEVFQLLLRYYADPTELHLPSHLCGPLLEKEMQKWNIRFPVNHLKPCCMHWAMDSKKWKMTLEDFEKGGLEPPPNDSVMVRELQNKIPLSMWLLVDRPSSSILSLMYAVIMSITSIAAAFVFSSEPLHRCSDWLKRVNDSCDLITEDYVYDQVPDSWRADESFMLWQCLISFLLTFDFVIRLCLSPCKRKFIVSPFTWIDFVSLLPMYAVMLLRMNHQKLYENSMPAVLLEFLGLCICFRVIRNFRRVNGMRVLMYTMKTGIRDLIGVFFMISLASCIFGTIYFFVEGKQTEQVPNIFVAIYWAFITITTVGYGDITPKSMPGKATAVVCSLCGLLVVAFTVPLLNDNFQRFYSHLETVSGSSTPNEEALNRVKQFIKAKFWKHLYRKRNGRQKSERAEPVPV